VLSFGYSFNEEILVYFVFQREGLRATVQTIDSFLTDVEAAAPFAVENGEPTVLLGAAGRSVPDFECNTVLLGGASIGVENFTASRIAPSENQLRHRHGESALSLIRSRKNGIVNILYRHIEWSSFL
jgi:hypothetical protein